MAYFPMSQCRSTTQSCRAKHKIVTSVVHNGIRLRHSCIRPGRRGVLPPVVEGDGRGIVVVVVPLRPADATADMLLLLKARAWIADDGLLFLQAGGKGKGPAFIQQAVGLLPACNPVVRL